MPCIALFDLVSPLSFSSSLAFCFFHSVSSVAVLTLWVTFLLIDITATSTTGVSRSPWAPALTSGYPADLGVTNSAAQPVTSLLFLNNDSALRAVHGFPRLYQGLKQVSSSPSSRVIQCASHKVILVLFTVHFLMDCLAEETVAFATHRAVEDIYSVLIHTPARAVRTRAVVAALTARLCHR